MTWFLINTETYLQYTENTKNSGWVECCLLFSTWVSRYIYYVTTCTEYINTNLNTANSWYNTNLYFYPLQLPILNHSFKISKWFLLEFMWSITILINSIFCCFDISATCYTVFMLCQESATLPLKMGPIMIQHLGVNIDPFHHYKYQTNLIILLLSSLG